VKVTIQLGRASSIYAGEIIVEQRANMIHLTLIAYQHDPILMILDTDEAELVTFALDRARNAAALEPEQP
jgi:hypothetical protein